jgi:hypothetical protein
VKKIKHMIVSLILLLIGISIAYIKLEKKNTKLEQEINLLKSKNSQLEREARDEANKKIILESILRNRTQNEDRKLY